MFVISLIYFQLNRWENGKCNYSSEEHLRNPKISRGFYLGTIHLCQKIWILSCDSVSLTAKNPTHSYPAFLRLVSFQNPSSMIFLLRIVLLYQRRSASVEDPVYFGTVLSNSKVKGQFYFFPIAGGRAVRYCSEVYTVCPPTVVCLGHVSGTLYCYRDRTLSMFERKPEF